MKQETKFVFENRQKIRLWIELAYIISVFGFLGFLFGDHTTATRVFAEGHTWIVNAYVDVTLMFFLIVSTFLTMDYGYRSEDPKRMILKAFKDANVPCYQITDSLGRLVVSVPEGTEVVV